jgi:hypothetical protein
MDGRVLSDFARIYHVFLTLGIRDLGYELDHAWEHTEAYQKDPVVFRGVGSISVYVKHGRLANQFHTPSPPPRCHSISGIGELIAL